MQLYKTQQLSSSSQDSYESCCEEDEETCDARVIPGALFFFPLLPVVVK